MRIKITNRFDDVLFDFENACRGALWECGLTAEGYAKKRCPVVTGNLRNSITHTVSSSELTAYVGTDSKYGPYVELGTGKYVEGGRPTPWVYQDAKGNWHWTEGQKAKPFIKPAVANHQKTYREIIKDELEGK